MTRISRIAAALPLAFLLWGCPKERKEAVVRFEDGNMIIDGDRSDCIVRLAVSVAEEGSGAYPLWSTESPMPISNDSTCPMRFPVAYGTVRPPVTARPRRAPRLQTGRAYRVSVDGFNADHEAEFTAP